jgi:hypothetical protein
LSCINCFYGLLGQEKPWCFIFSAKLRYEEYFFERISRILYFFVMFWRSIRNVVIVSVSRQLCLAPCVSYTYRIRVTSLRKLWQMLMLSSLLSRGIGGTVGLQTRPYIFRCVTVSEVNEIKETITETIPALVYFVHGVRLSTLQVTTALCLVWC